MRRLVPALVLLLVATAATQPNPFQPQKPLKYLPVEEVKKQIAEARGTPGPDVPSPEERRKIVAEVNGEPVTWEALLEEVLERFAADQAQGLLQNWLMRMEVAKRRTRITEEEFVATVRATLAQKKTVDTGQTLQEVIRETGISWETFERMTADKARLAKIVREDLHFKKSPEPLNPFVVQIWAGQKLRGHYRVEMDRTKLPPGILGRVQTGRPLSDLLEDLPAGGFTITANHDRKNPLITVAPTTGRWPRYTIPNLPIADRQGGGRAKKVAAVVALRAAAGGVKKLERYLRVGSARPDGPGFECPRVKVGKQSASQKPRGTAPLAELVTALVEKDFVLRDDGTATPRPGGWPVYTVPEVDVKTDAGTRSLAAALRDLTGRPGPAHVAARVRLNERYDLPDAPVPMVTMLDRESLLRFTFPSLKATHYNEALKSLARCRAVKQTFARLGIQVDEKAVKALIDAETRKYNHPLFNRQLILKAQGKTVFEEDRRLWVGNGVDQVIGTEVDEKTLRKYYRKNILHFGNAMVEACHILVKARNPETGKLDWERARRRIDQIAAELFSHPNPAGIFRELARKYSEDETSSAQGGDLGSFPLRHRMVPEFANAAFALRPREISAPVKTVHGYHLILCVKKTPPDLQKYAFEEPNTQERVHQEWQQERRDAWLEKNVYARMTVKKLAPIFAAGD